MDRSIPLYSPHQCFSSSKKANGLFIAGHGYMHNIGKRK
jgi:hypothetical protein